MITLNGYPLEVTIFPDKTSQVWKLHESVLTFSFALIRWDFENESEFMHLAQLKTLLDEYNVPSRLVIEYLPYGRQDKDVSNNSTFALNTFAKLLNSLQFKEVIVLDPHSSKARLLIDNCEEYYATDELDNAIYDTQCDTLCYPDKGAVSKYTGSYSWLNSVRNLFVLHGEKVRDESTGNITKYELIGDPKGKKVLIIDDICDGGATFKLLAKELLDKGAESVNLFVTHGIFSKGTKTLFDSGIDRIFTKKGEVLKT